MNDEPELPIQAAQVFRAIPKGLPEVQVETHFGQGSDPSRDPSIQATSGPTIFHFVVATKARITPQVALSACEQVRRMSDEAIPVLFAPVISPRVAEIIRGKGVSYVDAAGNCWLRNSQPPLLIERQGFATARKPTPAATDPFSPKSSRLVRAMLGRPTEGWQVRQLANLPETKVSAGPVVKVKRALIQEGYAEKRDRRLYLRDPVGLLGAWAREYPGPAEQVPLYFRGDAFGAENGIRGACTDLHLQFALGGFSAAWRLAPEVRYTVATVLVEDRGFGDLDRLISRSGGRRVETGANLILWRPYDPSVFFSGVDGEVPVTSALQTYLDLKRVPGRGDEAATAIFDKYLKSEFQAAVSREEERCRGNLRPIDREPRGSH